MLSIILQFIQRWKQAREGEFALSRLDDRALADIGISRSDIPRAAWSDGCR
jgi:uncharacterized protein YjiS (DUF1127 family)